MANNVVILYSLDPDDQKQSFIEYMQSKPEYTDYNFAGSNWNVLFDLLAQNSWKQAFYNNMSFSEGNIDSAKLRDSMISITKRLNYIPGSMVSSSTYLNVQFISNNITSFTIPSGTAFVGTNPNGTFMFRTNETYYQTSSNGFFSFSNVGVYEGNYTNDAFSYISGEQNPLFTLSNPFIDISSLTIKVAENNGSTVNKFSQAIDIYGIDGNSLVYFLQGTSANQYQIYFGDGVIGYKPQEGAVIQAQYRVTFGPQADGIGIFSLNDNLAGFNGGSIQNTFITAISNTSGGSNNENTDSIRFNAPLNFQTMDRAVTIADYSALIKKKFPSLKDVNVYTGGISAANTEIGTVVISAISSNGGPITQATQQSINSYLANLDVIHISTQFIDANTIYLDLNTNVHVNFSLSNGSSNSSYYQSLVANSVINYSSNFLEGYRKTFRFSRFTSYINGLDPSIISNETSILMRQQFPISLGTNTSFIFTFNNPVLHVNTNMFIINNNFCYLSDVINEDDPDAANGVVYLLNLGISGNTTVNTTPVGSVNYQNGNVSISNIQVNQFVNEEMVNFVAIPTNQDLYASNNFILEFDVVPPENILIISG